MIFIYRDEIYQKDSRYEGTAELIVVIQRDGAPGMARVQYEPGHFRFSNLPEWWRPNDISASAPATGSTSKPRRRGLAAALHAGAVE